MAKNLITKEEQEMIWFPKIVFENTRHKKQTARDPRTSTNIRNLDILKFDITDNTNAEVQGDSWKLIFFMLLLLSI